MIIHVARVASVVGAVLLLSAELPRLLQLFCALAVINAALAITNTIGEPDVGLE